MLLSPRRTTDPGFRVTYSVSSSGRCLVHFAKDRSSELLHFSICWTLLLGIWVASEFIVTIIVIIIIMMMMIIIMIMIIMLLTCFFIIFLNTLTTCHAFLRAYSLHVSGPKWCVAGWSDSSRHDANHYVTRWHTMRRFIFG